MIWLPILTATGDRTTVKTTIEIADDLADKARQLAAARGITLRAVIEEGLRLTLRAEEARPEFRLKDASVSGQGLQAEFRDAKWADLRDAAYQGRGA